jgi:hypothetical protein
MVITLQQIQAVCILPSHSQWSCSSKSIAAWFCEQILISVICLPASAIGPFFFQATEDIKC